MSNEPAPITAMKDAMKRAKSTPAEIAQRSLDAAQKRVDKADDAILKAKADLVEAQFEREDAVAVRDYRKGHPALKASMTVTPPVGSKPAGPGYPDGSIITARGEVQIP